MNTIDSMFMSHQNTLKEFQTSSCLNFEKNELESPIIAKIWDNFKGFSNIFYLFYNLKRRQKTLVGNLDCHKGF